MPLAGMRYSMPDVGSGKYFEPLLRYDASFAGDPSRKSINNLQFAPEVNSSFPDGWFLAFYPEPDIRWNFGRRSPVRPGVCFCLSTPALDANSPKR